MNWFDNAVVYHIYPLGYVGAAQNNDGLSETGGTPLAGPILGVLPHLPQIKANGFNTIFFGPVFESGSHGYDTVDYLTLDRRLGTNADFKVVCDEIHNLGMSVILDGVFNHVGRGFMPFKDVVQNKWNSRYKDWFFLNGGNSPYNDGFGYDCWEGHSMLVRLNLNNRETRDYLMNAITAWYNEFKIDGLRLDVAYCLDLDFLKELRRHCKNLKSDFWLMGETLHGDYNKWMNPEMLDSVTNYECYKGLYSSFNELNMFEIAHSLNRQFGAENWCLYRGKELYCFVDNHDVSRIVSRLKYQEHLSGIYTLLFTMPGVPGVYYGSEYSFKGEKQSGSDAVLRPKFDISEHAETPLSNVIKKLAFAHQTYPALYKGDYRQILLQNKYIAFSRTFEEQTVYSLINADSATTLFNLPGGGIYTDIFTAQQIDTSKPIQLNGYQTMVLVPGTGEPPVADREDVSAICNSSRAGEPPAEPAVADREDVSAISNSSRADLSSVNEEIKINTDSLIPTFGLEPGKKISDFELVNGRLHIKVGKDSAFKTVFSALEKIAYNQKATIHLQSGVYLEKILCDRADIEIIGEGIDNTIIEFAQGAHQLDDAGETLGTFRTYTAFFIVHRLVLKDLSIVNSIGEGRKYGQGIAAGIDSEKVYCENVAFKGHQDTLFTGPLPDYEIMVGGFKGPLQFRDRRLNHHYYRNCYIEGDVDFILGGANALFENCELKCLDRADTRVGGYITASSALPEEVGYLFYKCKVTTNSKKTGSYFLGRPWRENAATAFIECEIGEIINPKKFEEWNCNGVPRYYIYPKTDEHEIYGHYAEKELAAELLGKFRERYIDS
ncbi:MAG: pectinesterase family protein [Oscillospiraceae bacterium]|nr:pectinesterase family protein [Oscillospiraceae bacterium]